MRGRWKCFLEWLRSNEFIVQDLRKRGLTYHDMKQIWCDGFICGEHHKKWDVVDDHRILNNVLEFRQKHERDIMNE